VALYVSFPIRLRVLRTDSLYLPKISDCHSRVAGFKSGVLMPCLQSKRRSVPEDMNIQI
jgi:hypothetical protein